ncbi:NAD-dependent malic enzyme, mitochondrial [Pleurotus ostreatus]|uniref:NAD-dependent malic enzyme, mitochondrial n=1 Tax=Pleurotus ostreatus TaxID=5322 RepID=A0A8H7A0I5_PLEOS|nr:NAD-dependent malic enzyme, mitochondrial [Pleurotus ostreatus]KAF7436124.1 NAD-dependent malic enzyme, mitochondrial [Pleurotus ostreatus]
MSRDTAIRKNTFLQSLKDQNRVLYYSLIAQHLKALVPIIDTPRRFATNSRISPL